VRVGRPVCAGRELEVRLQHTQKRLGTGLYTSYLRTLPSLLKALLRCTWRAVTRPQCQLC
jgi:hypothetical protein